MRIVTHGRDEPRRCVQVEEHRVRVRELKALRRRVDVCSRAPSADPQQRRNGLKTQAVANTLWVLIREIEERGVLFEAFANRELVDELVVALDGLAVRRTAIDSGLDPRLRDVFADAECFPFGISGKSPWARRVAASSADTSLFVTTIDRRRPPSCLFSRMMAWAVVPEPAKKSSTSASGLEPRKNRSES